MDYGFTQGPRVAYLALGHRSRVRGDIVYRRGDRIHNRLLVELIHWQRAQPRVN